jgi:hypothetical protein
VNNGYRDTKGIVVVVLLMGSFVASVGMQALLIPPMTYDLNTGTLKQLPEYTNSRLARWEAVQQVSRIFGTSKKLRVRRAFNEN